MEDRCFKENVESSNTDANQRLYSSQESDDDINVLLDSLDSLDFDFERSLTDSLSSVTSISEGVKANDCEAKQHGSNSVAECDINVCNDAEVDTTTSRSSQTTVKRLNPAQKLKENQTLVRPRQGDAVELNVSNDAGVDKSYTSQTTVKHLNSTQQESHALLRARQRNVVELNKINASKVVQNKGSYSRIHQKKLQNKRKGNSVLEKSKIVESTGRYLESASGVPTAMVRELLKKHQIESEFLSHNMASPTATQDTNNQSSVNTTYSYHNGNTGLQSNQIFKKNIQPFAARIEAQEASQMQLVSSEELMQNRNTVLTNLVCRNRDSTNDSAQADPTISNDKMCCNEELMQDANKQLAIESRSSCTSSDYERQLPPISEALSSVRSAPANMETAGTVLQCGVPTCRPSTMCVPTGAHDHALNLENTGDKQHCEANSYASIHAKKYTYEPYTLNDYKRLLHNTTPPSSLGPDTNTKEFNEKIRKTVRIKQYAAIIREKHSVSKTQWKTKPIRSPKDNPKTKDANNRRKKALQYAKAVPKPVTTKPCRQTPPLKMYSNEQQPETLLDLLRQRHEQEKKAIDAVRKDLETKLKMQSS